MVLFSPPLRTHTRCLMRYNRSHIPAVQQSSRLLQQRLLCHIIIIHPKNKFPFGSSAYPAVQCKHLTYRAIQRNLCSISFSLPLEYFCFHKMYYNGGGGGSSSDSKIKMKNRNLLDSFNIAGNELLAAELHKSEICRQRSLII